MMKVKAIATLFPHTPQIKMTVSTFGLPSGPTTSSNEPILSFDDLGRLRIHPSHVFEEAEKTRDESQDFVRGTYF